MGLWTDALGRAAVRGVQLLVLVAVGAVVLHVLLAVKVVVLAVLVALILASAVRPLVSALERHGWHSAPAAAVVFLGLLALLGAVVTGVVLGIRGAVPDLTAAAARRLARDVDTALAAVLAAVAVAGVAGRLVADRRGRR